VTFPEISTKGEEAAVMNVTEVTSVLGAATQVGPLIGIETVR
jgi:hypothetical protein